MSGNPFTAAARRWRAAVDDPEALDPAGAEQGALLFGAAGSLWDLLDTLPPCLERRQAKSRLEEAIYWAVRAAGSTWE